MTVLGFPAESGDECGVLPIARPAVGIRVTCGVMPGSQGDGRTTDPFVGSVVLALTVLAYVVVGRAAGLTWKTLLHWAGEILLITGIVLAAVGISDVRREWTRLPGIRGRAAQATRVIQARAVSFLWACWNWIVQWRWLAGRLHLRPPQEGRIRRRHLVRFSLNHCHRYRKGDLGATARGWHRRGAAGLA